MPSMTRVGIIARTDRPDAAPVVRDLARWLQARGRQVVVDRETATLLPDGRTQTRFVRVCRDSSGRYAVVD